MRRFATCILFLMLALTGCVNGDAGALRAQTTTLLAQESSAPAAPAAQPYPDVIRWKADKSVMVKVSAGAFMMGGTKNENEKPRHKVTLPLYYIDRTEITYRQYLTFVKDTGHRPPVTFITMKPFPQSLLEHPVSNVDWNDADAYCRHYGKKLPSEEEWEKACAGPKGLEFSWGNGWNANACTNRTNSNDQTNVAGARASCRSPYGAMDMSGNLMEWTDAWYKSYPGADFTFDQTGKARVARGGCYFYSIYLLRCAARQSLPQDDASETNGFRCVVVPGKDFSDKIEQP